MKKLLIPFLVCTWGACAFAQTLSGAAALRQEPESRYRVTPIAEGEGWVSSYWGYTAPKLAYDGETYYTAALWGGSPEQAYGTLYAYRDGEWEAGQELPDMYQPPALLLDSSGRLVVLYARQGKPPVLLRARKRGAAEGLEALEPHPAIRNAYYIGAAIRQNTLYMAYLTSPSYNFYLTQLDLDTMQWSEPLLVQEGYVRAKPKTAWTYPVLLATAEGLHLVTSNCPDGGDGNTYDRVWYLFFPEGSNQYTLRQEVAACPMGHIAYAMDMIAGPAGGVHIVLMWNVHKYGAPLPETQSPAGTYHAWRDNETEEWNLDLIAPPCVASLYGEGVGVDSGRVPRDEMRLFAITQQQSAITSLQWNPEGAEGERWRELPPLYPREEIAAAPVFMDVIHPGSGSVMGDLALVSDGLLPGAEGEPSQRTIWAVLPDSKAVTE